MTWFKVDDGLHSHPKWLAASPHARALWVTAGSWVSAHLTDGHVPRHALASLGGRPKDAADLVRLGLWEQTDDGWRFHEWNLDSDGSRRNPTREEVEAERSAARERQRRARNKSRESRRDSNRDSRRDSRREFGPPDPTRPISPLPPHTTPTGQADTAGRKRPEEKNHDDRPLPAVGDGLEPDHLWPVMAERAHQNLTAAGQAPPKAGARRNAWLRVTAVSLAEEHAEHARELLADYEHGTSAEAVIRALDPDLARHDPDATTAGMAARAAELAEWEATTATPEQTAELADVARQHIAQLRRGKVDA